MEAYSFNIPMSGQKKVTVDEPALAGLGSQLRLGARSRGDPLGPGMN